MIGVVNLIKGFGNFEVKKKLERIIKMNTLNHSVNCLFETTSGLSIEGIPLRIEDEYVIIYQNNIEEKILLCDIKEIIILKV